VTLPTKNIPQFRQAINEFYHSLGLIDQVRHLQPKPDAAIDDFVRISPELIKELKRLEPFGNGNPSPIFHIPQVTVLERRLMGKEQQHLKLKVQDGNRRPFSVIGFNLAEKVPADAGDMVELWVELIENEWRGRVTIEGRLLRAETL
jgi:single-stranded-DNA-specific exonuclease